MNLPTIVRPAKVLEIFPFEKIVDLLSRSYKHNKDHPISFYGAVDDALFSLWCSYSLTKDP